MADTQKWDWNDVRCFLAVLREGSTLRAAPLLGISQTTCARRISALELGLGISLFIRAPGGYEPTAAAKALGPIAERIEGAASEFSLLAARMARERTQTIRLTAGALYADAVAAAVARFKDRACDVLVEVDSSDVIRDLAAGEADLGLRGGFQPQGQGLVVRQLWPDTAGIYCSKSYAAVHGTPELVTITNHPLVMLSGVALDRAAAAGLGPSIRHVVSSQDALLAALRAGAYVGALSDSVAMCYPDLVRCFPIDVPLGAWLVFPEHFRHDSNHRVLRDLLAEELIKRHDPRLRG